MSSYVQYAAWAILLAAAVQDILTLRISNILSVLLILLFPAWVMATQPSLDVWRNLAMFGLALAIGIPLFAKKWLGGGDVKIFAAAALWFDVADAPSLLFWISIGGGALALLLVIARRVAPAALTQKAASPALKPRGPIPYGVAIAGGAIWCSLVAGFHPSRPVPALLRMPIVPQTTAR